MMSLKKKIIISAASLLVLIILFIVFIIYPLLSDVKDISRSIPLKKQEFAGLERKTESLNNFRNQLADRSLALEKNLEKINTLFIDSRRLVDFRNFLYKTAASSKISLDNMAEDTSSRPADSDYWKFIALELDLSGPFPNFSNLLEKLQSGPYLIEMQNLSISSEGKPPELDKFYLGDVKAKLLIKVYIR